MKMTALDYLTESANADALRALLDTLSETVSASASAALSVATAADRWQENLISDDLLKIREDLDEIRARVLTHSLDVHGRSTEAGRKARELIAQADTATQEN